MTLSLQLLLKGCISTNHISNCRHTHKPLIFRISWIHTATNRKKFMTCSYNPWTDANLHIDINKSCITGIENRWTINGLLIHLLIPHHRGYPNFSSSTAKNLTYREIWHDVHATQPWIIWTLQWSLFFLAIVTVLSIQQLLERSKKYISYPSLDNMCTIHFAAEICRLLFLFM